VLRLGTRASALALVQACAVARALERAHRGRRLRVELVEITTRGDRDRRSPLKSFGGTGVFVKELERALLEKRVDFAVHSLKDLPTRLARGLALAAVTRREDVRDVALTRAGAGLAELPAGARLGTSSPRRRAQLARRFPALDYVEIRGNVETRLRKVAAGEYAATVLAHAGLKRLGWRVPAGGGQLALPKGTSASPAPATKKVADAARHAAHEEGSAPLRLHAELLPLAVMLPAPGQGALALECRAKDGRTRALLRVLHDVRVAACVRAERACLSALGGGCHLPLGALGTSGRGGSLRLRAALASDDGAILARADVWGSASRPEALGRRAARMLTASSR
jgi:hydroxymethylbilane synthase